MKLNYATPELARDSESQSFGAMVVADLQDISGERGETLEATVACEPKENDRQFIITLKEQHPAAKVAIAFRRSDLRDKWFVKYRLSKAYVELRRAQVVQSITEMA